MICFPLTVLFLPDIDHPRQLWRSSAWLPFMEWIAWGYAIFVLAMIYIDWRMAGDIKQFELMREHDTKLSLGARKPDNGSALRNAHGAGPASQSAMKRRNNSRSKRGPWNGHIAPRGTWSMSIMCIRCEEEIINSAI